MCRKMAKDTVLSHVIKLCSGQKDMDLEVRLKASNLTAEMDLLSQRNKLIFSLKIMFHCFFTMTFFYQAGHRLLKVNQKALSFGLVASATLFASIKWKPSEVQAQSVTADAKAVDNGIGTVSSSEESLFKLKKMGHYENRLR